MHAMGLHDRDWYQDVIREREGEEGRAQARGATAHGRLQPAAGLPWRAALLTFLVIALAAIAIDVRAMGAPLTARGLRFWWSVRAEGLLPAQVFALAGLALLIFFSAAWVWRGIRSRRRPAQAVPLQGQQRGPAADPRKAAQYDPKQFRRPRQ